MQRLGLRLPPQSKIVVRIASLFFGALALASTAQAKLNVVATTPDLASIAREIGGDKIELTTLAKATEDPHFVDAKPSFIVKLNRADVLIEGGAELEIGWRPRSAGLPWPSPMW